MSDRTGASSSKVERIITHYQLDGVAKELEQRWTEPEESRASLRELADEFNQRVLKSAMENADLRLLDGEVENTYRLLTTDDVSLHQRNEARNKLERNGIDVRSLKNDFVSHQSIYTYLTKHRGVTYQKSPVGDRKERGIDKISALQNRTEKVTADTLRRLINADEVVADGFSISLDIEVLCESCRTKYPVLEFIEHGGCSCTFDGGERAE